MKKIFGIAVLALASTAAFAASEPVAIGKSHNNDVFVGYTRVGAIYAGYGGAVNGVEIGAHGAFNRYIGIEGDYTNGLGNSSSGALLLVGPRGTYRIGRGDVFGHALVGGEFASGVGVGAYAIGGGADIPVVSR